MQCYIQKYVYFSISDYLQRKIVIVDYPQYCEIAHYVYNEISIVISQIYKISLIKDYTQRKLV